jgi:hypothetical protein
MGKLFLARGQSCFMFIHPMTYTVGLLHYSNASASVRNSTFFEYSSGLVIEAEAVVDGVVPQVWYENTS